MSGSETRNRVFNGVLAQGGVRRLGDKEFCVSVPKTFCYGVRRSG